jgi:hypothetical protein
VFPCDCGTDEKWQRNLKWALETLNMVSSRWVCALALAGAAWGAANASASTTFDFFVSNVSGFPPNPPPYASIDLAPITVGTVSGVQFTVTSLSAGCFVDKFYFNDDLSNDTLRLVSTTIVSPPAPMPALNASPDAIAADGFGKFNYLFDTNDPANFALTQYSFIVVAQNNGVDVSSAVSDYIMPSANPNGGNLFAGHIKTTNNSSFIAGIGAGGPVPEPASLILLASGALCLFRRRHLTRQN